MTAYEADTTGNKDAFVPDGVLISISLLVLGVAMHMFTVLLCLLLKV